MKHVNIALLLLSIIVCGIFSGCSSDKSPVSNSVNNELDNPIPIIGLNETGRVFTSTELFGAFELSIDTAKMEAELHPKRYSTIGESYIVSVMGFFTITPCPDCLTIEVIDFVEDGVSIGFGIEHPFQPPDPLLPPSAINRGDLDIFGPVMAVDNLDPMAMEFEFLQYVQVGLVDNACGYTTDLTHLLGDPTALPYVAIIDDDESETFTYNRFPMGATAEFDVVFNLEPGEKVDLDLYLTAGYGASATKPTRLDPQYFNPEFNRKAPWKVNVIPPQGEMPPMIENTWTNIDPETPHYVTVQVFDWQIGANVNPNLDAPTDVYAASEISEVIVEVPGMDIAYANGSDHDGLGDGSPGNPLNYHIPLYNVGLLEEGEYTGLVKVIDERAVIDPPPAGDRDFLIDSPDGIELINYPIPEYATYQVFTVTVVMGLEGILIQQIDYTFEDETVTDSAYGSVTINYMGEPELQFFNLNVEGEWVLGNMPLLPIKGPGNIQSVTMTFDLGVPDGTDVSVLNIGWGITPDTQLGPPPIMGAVYVYPRTTAAFIGDIDFSFWWPFWPDNHRLRDAGPWHFVGPYFPNQECNKHECVPAAVSNSLAFLQNTQDVPPPGKLYDIENMKDATDWRPKEEGINGWPGGSPGDWAETKDQYMTDNGYDIDTDCYPDPIQRDHEATEAECDQAMTALQNGADLELRGGHHCACIVGMVKTTNEDGTVSYEITVQHDTDQGEQGGCRSEVITYTPPQGGNPSDVDGGSPGFFDNDIIKGFTAETAAD